jgi:hypothetical protein
MRVYWMLRGGESIEVYDGSDPDAKKKIIVYRIGVERMIGAEVKVVRPNGTPKILNAESRSLVIDVATSGSLFLEVLGNNGVAFGWYEAINQF